MLLKRGVFGRESCLTKRIVRWQSFEEFSSEPVFKHQIHRVSEAFGRDSGEQILCDVGIYPHAPNSTALAQVGGGLSG